MKVIVICKHCNKGQGMYTKNVEKARRVCINCGKGFRIRDRIIKIDAERNEIANIKGQTQAEIRRYKCKDKQ